MAAPDKAQEAKPLYAHVRGPILNHPHPYPPRKGEGAETSRAFRNAPAGGRGERPGATPESRARRVTVKCDPPACKGG